MKLRILLAVAAAVVTAGCARFDTRMEMRRFFKSTVEVTDTLGCIYERNMTFECIDGGMLKFIVYVVSTECSSCEMRQIPRLKPLYELADSLGTFEVYTIFSPSQDEYNDVLEQLVFMNFEYPLYVDVFGDFQRKNTCIPVEKKYHCFLLDKEGHPVFVGNHLANADMMRLFLKVLNRI